MAAQILMKRGKRALSSTIKSECLRQNHQQLKDVLDYLLDPLRPIDELENLEWLKCLVAGGQSLEEFAKTVRQYDNAVTCGLVWTANFVAYRCRTCGLSPCMSLCADCFNAADHAGHDYNMFRSQAGGACDCGDTSVMDSKGFCAKHGPDKGTNPSSVPGDMLIVAETMMPRLFHRLLCYLRDNCKPEMVGSYKVDLQDAEPFMGFLHFLSEMGTAMRTVICKVLTDPDVYKKFTEVEQCEDGACSNSYLKESQEKYLAAFTNMRYPIIFEDFSDLPGLTQSLEHHTLLEELFFWLLKFEFPQKILTLMLSLLPDEQYKDAFTRSFVKHYSRMSAVLVTTRDRTTAANSVVHISVQLFSNEALANRMVEEYNLLYILVLSLTRMLEQLVTSSFLQDPDTNFHMVVDCAHTAMKEHCYWPIVSDLINLLSHPVIAKKFLSDDRLIRLWLDMLSYFQGMNLNQRELTQHVEFEPDTYYAAFSAELEISASPMWSLISHCRDQCLTNEAIGMIRICFDTLQDWFDAIGCKDSTKPNPYQLTFHLPLHRHLSLFLANGVLNQGVDLSDLIPPERLLKCLMIHLLHIQVGLTEIYNGMWVRNGLQIKGQAMTYVQCHFCYSMIDADLYLLQVCASKLDPDYFVRLILDRFHLSHWLSLSSDPSELTFQLQPLQPEQELGLLEGALTLLATLQNHRVNLGMTESELMRVEMANLLCVADRTHSQLMDCLPEKSGTSNSSKELLERTLKEVADYKPPTFEAGSMQQGQYTLKDDLWETDFDPLHVLLRAVHKKDLQTAMDRYADRMRHLNKYKNKDPPWPPFRPATQLPDVYAGLRRLLHCKTMHGFLFTVIYKILKEPSIPDCVVYYCIYLLDLASSTPPVDATKKLTQVPEHVHDMEYYEWFPTNTISQNIRQVIGNVLVEKSASTASLNVEPPLLDMEVQSIEEMFAMVPSVIASTSGPITSAHTGVIPSLMPVSPAVTVPPPATTQYGIAMATSTTKYTATKPKYESRGVATEALDSNLISVTVNESFISLLIKLHSKLSGKDGSFSPGGTSKDSLSMQTGRESVIGDGPKFVGVLLNKISSLSQTCANQIDDICKGLYSHEMMKAEKKDSQDKEKRRARLRQQKLMAHFASKQKAFMEQAMDTDEFSADFPEEEMKDSIDSAQSFDCVICNQNTPSTKDRPMGLVVFLQATCVLGHRQQQCDHLRTLRCAESKRPPAILPTCATYYRRKLDTLMKNFDDSSCQMSMNIGWEGGVHVQSCGHYLHLDCHSSYTQSLAGHGHSQSLLVSKGEYWCPLCRQLANSVVPVVPEELSNSMLCTPVPHDRIQIIHQMADMMRVKSHYFGSGSLTTAMGHSMENITNATYPVFKRYSSYVTTESMLLFVCSVARTNLELELQNRGGHLSSDTPSTSVSPKKPAFLPLLAVLSMHTRILATTPYSPYIDLWSHITGVALDNDESTSVSVRQKEIPVLLKDPVSLLIQFILMLPPRIEPEHYKCLVQMLYNVAFIQALATISCKFPEEERSAWKSKGRMVSSTKLEGLLSHVITRLECGRLYDDSDMAYSMPAICQSVWSPHSIESAVQDHCIPLLRIASLLKQHLFSVDIQPEQSGQSEFETLLIYLNLSRSVSVRDNQTPSTSTVAFASYKSLRLSSSWSSSFSSSPSSPAASADAITSASCVSWVQDEPFVLTRAWCMDLISFINLQPSEGRSLLSMTPAWHQPQLIILPDQYYKIFQHYHSKTCAVCSGVPKDPALCLVCGQFLCFKEVCCRQQNTFECVQHSIECGAGCGIFMLINSSVLVVIRGPRATLWGSVYLDKYGEEDRDLKRGKPLVLNDTRYNLLQSQWRSHTFDPSCKRWILHQDKL